MADDQVGLLVLVVSELCTNAILHGQAGEFGLRGTARVDGKVRLEVRDWSPSAVPSPQHGDPLDENGRGLPLVEAIVTKELGGAWGFSTDGAVAWCEVPLISPNA